MDAPDVSVVVPTLNEEQCIDQFLQRVSRFLESRAQAWEIVVVDDGSTDRTGALIEQWAAADPRVRLVRQSHHGKGAAVRRGMLAARGRWRFMADADLSVAPEHWPGLLAPAPETAAAVIVGSREAPGSERIGEPVIRHLIGRAFNLIVQLVLLPGINDTQCGFKLFHADAARSVFPRLTVDGFAFDVEALFLARQAGFHVREVGVVWTCRADSRVSLARGAAAFADVVRIRLNAWRGRYRCPSDDPTDVTSGDGETSTLGRQR